MTLKIRLEVPDAIKAGHTRVVYTNTIDVSESLSFDYETLICGLKLLYPYKNLVINLILV